MADVRGASGVPPLVAFGGQSAPNPSTPLYVDLATGDLYVVINETVTLVGQIPAGSSYTLANRVFRQRDTTPQAVLGEASSIIGQRSMSPHQLPTMWG
jgi:hypothetical protein